MDIHIDMNSFTCMTRIFDPVSGQTLAEHLLPVESLDPEHAAAATLASTVTFSTTTDGLTKQANRFCLPTHRTEDLTMAVLETDTLALAYDDDGPREGPVVLLLHGWPDDVSTWDDVRLALHGAGLRTVVPSLRGFGATRFLGPAAPRTANSGIHALDMIALMNGLGVDRFMVAGHDWGSNIAEALAVGWPRRVERMAMLATPPRLGGMPSPPFWHAQRNGIIGSWRRLGAQKPSAPIRRASHTGIGRTGHPRAGSTRPPFATSPSLGTIPISST